MALHKEQERICRELGNKDGLSDSLGNQAMILQDRGDLDGAMALHKEKERICRELGNKDGLQQTLGNQALILHGPRRFGRGDGAVQGAGAHLPRAGQRRRTGDLTRQPGESHSIQSASPKRGSSPCGRGPPNRDTPRTDGAGQADRADIGKSKASAGVEANEFARSSAKSSRQAAEGSRQPAQAGSAGGQEASKSQSERGLAVRVAAVSDSLTASTWSGLFSGRVAGDRGRFTRHRA